MTPEIVAVVRTLQPRGTGVRTALLGCPEDPAPAVLDRAVRSGHDEIHPHVRSVQAAPQVVAAARACGVTVVPWTVNAQRDVRQLERLGVAGLITDVPVAARAAVNRAAV